MGVAATGKEGGMTTVVVVVVGKNSDAAYVAS